MTIEFRQSGDFNKVNKILRSLVKAVKLRKAEKYAQMGLEALMAATPKRTGLTSKSWVCKIIQTDTTITISYTNTNIQNGVPIAIVLDYGHFSRGHWIAGRHYIEPAIRPVFDQIENELWEEINNLYE